MQFVVQDALLISFDFPASFSLTPITWVGTFVGFEGEEMIARLARAFRCCDAPSSDVKRPVHSRTTSTFIFPHGSFVGAFWARTGIFFPSMMRLVASDETLLSHAWYVESCFRRCARVFASVRSFTATTSNPGFPNPALNVFRPIRPNPLMAMRGIVGAL